MLSYIEKGKRFPTETLVKQLAAVRGEAPEALLVLLWKDRILYVFSRELRKAIVGKKGEETQDIDDSAKAFLIGRAIAALPDDGTWKASTKWRKDLKKVISNLRKEPVENLLEIVVKILKKQHLIEERAEQVRRLGRHYVPDNPDEKQALALEFCTIFTKTLLEKVVRKDQKTYLRNHYLQIPEEKIETFHKQLDQMVKDMAETFATEEGEAGPFLNVLITSTKR